jgi:prepilin-type N-terminal cleavage/methylation domain-containing protein
MTKAELKSRLQSVDVSGVKGRSLKRKFETIRNKKEGGFTLLELLVVIAILAAIAGTATIMLQDTDRKASAGAHVAMMDQLSKGIQTYRVLNSGLYPNVWDSLLSNSTNSLTGAADPVLLSIDLTATDGSAGNIKLDTLNADDITALGKAGITHVRVVDPAAQSGECAPTTIQALVEDKSNDIVPGNIFRIEDANGCGYDDNSPLATGNAVFIWGDVPERVGVPLGTTGTAVPKLVAFGVGPDSTLFNPEIIGALSNVPTYRHVETNEYNRFIVLWNVGSIDKPAGQATFQAIIDGAGDTKDEELGEADNIRAT